jgi:hypothetical protein
VYMRLYMCVCVWCVCVHALIYVHVCVYVCACVTVSVVCLCMYARVYLCVAFTFSVFNNQDILFTFILELIANYIVHVYNIFYNNLSTVGQFLIYILN